MIRLIKNILTLACAKKQCLKKADQAIMTLQKNIEDMKESDNSPKLTSTTTLKRRKINAEDVGLDMRNGKNAPSVSSRYWCLSSVYGVSICWHLTDVGKAHHHPQLLRLLEDKNARHRWSSNDFVWRIDNTMADSVKGHSVVISRVQRRRRERPCWRTTSVGCSRLACNEGEVGVGLDRLAEESVHVRDYLRTD